MMSKRKSEEMKLFVANLLNDEQDAHAKLVAELRDIIGKTQEFEDTLKVLTQIYEAKVELLEKIYKEM
ncbi:hypothetical protein LCGC14_1023450 [marine sediment metagenome]|uniref:Uncharacterized protein n=1 Tax=marine sediment metagenome TaxID=412755 RepID=A0A0F9NIC6_9ZZZZ